MRAALHRSLAGTLALLVLVACSSESPPPASSTGQVPSTDPGDGDRPTPDGPTVDPATPAAADAGDPSASSVPSQVWSPALQLPAKASVNSVLRLAAAAEKEARWFDGENSALALYWQALQLDGENEKAIAGRDRVLAEIRSAFDAALASRDWDGAGRHAAALAALESDPQSQRIWWDRIRRKQHVVSLLDEAQTLRDGGRWIEPEGDSAADRYREALVIDDGDAEAMQGLREIEAHLLDQAMRAATDGEFRRADRLLADAASVLPGSQTVQDASAQLMIERTRRTEQMLVEAQAALGELDFATVEALLDKIDAASAQVAGVDDLRARLDNARIYGALNPGQRFFDGLSAGGTGPEMRVLPIGRYQMGSPESEPQRKKNESPRHRVELNQPIAMSITEITVAEFNAFATQAQYVTDAERAGRSTIYDERNGRMVERRRVNWRHDHAGERAAPELPVVHVSWRDAKAYAAWLQAQTGKPYRLPTESEFEYAVRAGSESRYPWGEGGPGRRQGNLTGENDRSASKREWVNAFTGYGDGYWGPAPAGSFKENAFGLQDTEGNVSEWVEDCWHDSYKRAPDDGSAWINPGCSKRVARGASWASAPDQARSAFRLGLEPDTTNPRLGFRVARALDRPTPTVAADAR